MSWPAPASSVAGLVLVALGVLAGMALQRSISATSAVAEVTAAEPSERQDDGSLIAERRPRAEPSPAPHAIPAGAKEVRRVAVTVKPVQADCDPVHVDMSLVQVDGGQRVVVSSPDGEISKAIDIPIIPAALPAAPKRWAAGASFEPFTERVGLWAERDLGRIRVGLDLKQSDHGSAEAWLRVGFNF